MRVQWDRESKIRNPERPKISTTFHSDICDAVLYAWRECRHYLSQAPKIAPERQTEAYMIELEAKEAEEMQKKLDDPESYEYDKMLEEDFNGSDW